MTFTQYQAIISLLYKKGVREDIKNWRPISLLNNDYKIITKILSNRLRSVINEIIHEDQRGCIPGRNSSDCVRMLEDLIENEVDENSCVLLLDQEKAFDRVEFTWLFETLEAFGFGKKFQKWIKILYKDANSAILTNGRISRFFPVKRGVRQGDSLSALLFIIQAEPLAETVRDSPNIEGITSLSYDNKITEFQLSQYADDTTIILKHYSMISECLNILSDFGLASGSRLNIKKTKGLIFSQNFPPGRNIEITHGPEKVLGIPVGKNLNMSETWNKKTEKIKNCFSVWRNRNLSYKGKVQLINTYGISNILYTLQVKDMGLQELKLVNNALWHFLWDGKNKGLVNREICMMPRNSGGLGMPDLNIITQSMPIAYVNKVLSEPDAKWKLFPRKFFASLDSTFKTTFFLLQVTDSMPHICHMNIPGFYINCIKHYQYFLKINTNTPSTSEAVRKEILWHNHRIQFNGKSLNFHHWALSGILRINDICTDGQISVEKIKNTLRNRSNLYFEFSKLMKAIPKEWINLLDKNYQMPEDFNTDQPPGIHVPKLRNMTFKDIRTNLAKSKSVKNKSISYWKGKFGDLEIDWSTLWARIFLDRLIPRKICDFNWRVFYGVLPIENRLKSMRKSDGMCKICNCQAETLKHLFLECNKLGSIWNMVQQLFRAVLRMDILIDYKTIILGKDGEEKNSDVINMVVFICKLEIWKRRNILVFEMQLIDPSTLWKIFMNVLKTHINTVLKSNCRWLNSDKIKILKSLDGELS